MAINRREFIAAASGVLAVAGVGASPPVRPATFRAIAFDAFPIFDPRPVGELAESLFPGRGRVFMDAWRTRQFEYQWLRALAGRYADFIQTTTDSARFAAKQLQLELSAADLERLIGAHAALKPWPDAARAVERLHRAKIRLVFLSNMTRRWLEDGLKAAGIQDAFEQVLSTDAIRSYKPDPRAYQMGVDKLSLRREEILFVPFAGWDAAGAKWFGYPTFWVSRLGSPMEELGVVPDGAGRDLAALVQFALGEGDSGEPAAG